MEHYVVVDASAMAKEISLTGKVAVYGIHFDTGKAVVKPDSRPAKGPQSGPPCAGFHQPVGGMPCYKPPG